MARKAGRDYRAMLSIHPQLVVTCQFIVGSPSAALIRLITSYVTHIIDVTPAYRMAEKV